MRAAMTTFIDSSDKELDKLLKADPRSKEDFQEFSTRIVEYIVKRHQHKPMYATFVEEHVRELAAPLKDIEVRKAASALTTLANEKQKEQRDKASGKKKTKAAAKPALGSAKATNKYVPGKLSLNILTYFTVIDTLIQRHMMRLWTTLALTISCRTTLCIAFVSLCACFCLYTHGCIIRVLE